ncbi:MAG: hypothetical protein IPP79_14445 [Chitinophagaceae bacterium]|nr:hypothetical protein [Chitinophagaceae bacterium]
MKLPELNSDNKFLKSVRYETGYNPFSIKFNKSLNDKLYKKAVAGNAKNSTLNLIRAGAHFNTTIHEPLFDELKTVHQK